MRRSSGNSAFAQCGRGIALREPRAPARQAEEAGGGHALGWGRPPTPLLQPRGANKQQPNEWPIGAADMGTCTKMLDLLGGAVGPPLTCLVPTRLCHRTWTAPPAVVSVACVRAICVFPSLRRRLGCHFVRLGTGPLHAVSVRLLAVSCVPSPVPVPVPLHSHTTDRRSLRQI